MNIISIDMQGAFATLKKMEQYDEKVKKVVDRVLTANTKTIERVAKRLAPADRSYLRQGISSHTETFLEKKVTANAPYAAYVEFGTGKYAAQYVATLPAHWQEFAAKAKGPAGGDSFTTFVFRIYEWMGRKGIKAGTYSVKTRRRKGSAAQKATEDLELAYWIARSIYMKGVKPHPYLYPAYTQQEVQIKKDLEAAFTALKL